LTGRSAATALGTTGPKAVNSAATAHEKSTPESDFIFRPHGQLVRTVVAVPQDVK